MPSSSKYGSVAAYQTQLSVNQSNLNHNNNNGNSAILRMETDPLLKQRSQAVGLEVLHRAAVKIQALWRGYRARAHMDKVTKVCQEVRLRRLEEYVLDIQSKMAATNKLLLK